MTKGAETRSGRHRATPARRGSRTSRAEGATASARARYAWPLACAAIFALALIWRLAYLARLSRTPLFGDLIVDAADYWNWASALRAGAAQSTPFYLGPLYPTWLWLMRSALGDEIRTVLSAQSVLGAVGCALIADAARRLTRPAIGFAIGIIAALYSMAVFFDGLILMEATLWVLLAWLMWWVCANDWRVAGAARYALTGATIALIAEGRSTGLVLLAPAALLLPSWRDGARRMAGGAAAMLAAFAIVAAPAAIQNHRLSGQWIPFTYNFGYNLYVGNNPEATGTDVTITGTQSHIGATQSAVIGGGEADGREYLRSSQHLALGPLESSNYWANLAWRYMRANPAHAAALHARKLAMMWSAHEYAQIENADEFDQLAGPLGAPFVGTFAFIGVLAVAGLARLRAAGRRAWFVASSCAALTAVAAVFFVTDRYRHSLVPGALVLAALGLDAIWLAWKSRARRDVLTVIALLALGLIVTRLPIPHLGGYKYEWGLEVDLGGRWLKRGKPDLAITYFQRAADLESHIHFEGGITGAMERTQLYVNYGRALSQLDRTAESLTWFERADAIAPDDADVVSSLAAAYRRLGRDAEAAPLEKRLQSLAGGSGLLFERQGFEAARAGSFASAESLFAQAVALDPTLFDAWGALIRLRVQRADLAAASATLARSRAAGLPEAPSNAYEALIAAIQGDRDQALRALARVPKAALDADPTLAQVVAIARQHVGF